MFWLHPAVLFGFGVVAAPIVIHLLVQRRAERLAFPTLRFLRPARLASVRRRVLDDLPLLAVRCAILAAAVAALAGPIVATASRRAAWDRRVTRAVVREGDGAPAAASAVTPAFRAQEFTGAPLRDGVRRALAWLESAPPSRRELLIASSLAIGSITAADLAAVPPDVGIRFERASVLPATRTVTVSPVLTADGVVARTATLAGPATSVEERPASVSAGASWPIDVVASPARRQAIDAAVRAVLERRVAAPAPDRKARIVVLDLSPEQAPSAASVRTAWIADAIARLARDVDLQAAARRLSSGIGDARFAREPWEPIAHAADGAPVIAAAAADGRLVIASGAPASSIATPILVRAAANALAPIVDLQRQEIVPIADEDLRAWSRPAGPAATGRLGNVDEDDRRWLWAAVLLLLAFETWLRRARRSDAASTQPEDVRVA